MARPNVHVGENEGSYHELRVSILLCALPANVSCLQKQVVQTFTLQAYEGSTKNAALRFLFDSFYKT